MRDFKKYDIWQNSHEFALEVYKISSNFPANEQFGIVGQIRRASVSIPTNICEGCGRNSDAEFNQFLNIALGSASETEYLLILSNDLGFIADSHYKILNQKINEIKSKIYNLKKVLTQK